MTERLISFNISKISRDHSPFFYFLCLLIRLVKLSTKGFKKIETLHVRYDD